MCKRTQHVTSNNVGSCWPTTSHVHHTFFYISLPSLHNYDVKMPNFTFMEDVNKRGRIFFLLYLNLSAVPKKFTRYSLTLSLNWNKHAKKNPLKFILKVTFSLPSLSLMRKLPWYLKESLRTYKLLPLQNEYGDWGPRDFISNNIQSAKFDKNLTAGSTTEE